MDIQILSSSFNFELHYCWMSVYDISDDIINRYLSLMYEYSYNNLINISWIQNTYHSSWLVPRHTCFCLIHWSHVLSWEWRCSWSSDDRRCSNYIWVINDLIARDDAPYIRGMTVNHIYILNLCLHCNWHVAKNSKLIVITVRAKYRRHLRSCDQ